MIRRQLLLFFSFGFWFSFASAQVHQTLAKITCDDEPESSLLSLTVEDGVIQKIRFDSKEETKVYTVEQISRGVVLVREKGFEAIRMKAAINMTTGKGQVEVHYLAEALMRKYSVCNGSLVRSNDGGWRLLNRSGQTVRAIKVITTLTGIRTITGICD